MTDIKLPEPVAAQANFEPVGGTSPQWGWCSVEHHTMARSDQTYGRNGYKTRALYTEEQMNAYADQKVREALENQKSLMWVALDRSGVVVNYSKIGSDKSAYIMRGFTVLRSMNMSPMMCAN